MTFMATSRPIPIASAVYLAHAACTQEAENLISIDLCSRCECHSAADDSNENVGGFEQLPLGR